MNSNDPCLWRNPTLIKNEKKKIVKIIEIDEFFRHLEILEILICSLKGRCGHFDPKFFGLRYILQCKLLWNSTILGLMFTHEESFMCQNVLRFYRLWHKFWFSWVFFFSTSKNDRIEENDLYKFFVIFIILYIVLSIDESRKIELQCKHKYFTRK